MPDSEEVSVPESSSTPQDDPSHPAASPESDTADRFSQLTPDELQDLRDRGRGEYGCRHYRRRVKFITPCW